MKAIEDKKTHNAIMIHPSDKFTTIEYKREDIFPNPRGYFAKYRSSVGPYPRKLNMFDGVAMVLYEDSSSSTEINRYGTKLMGRLGCNCGGTVPHRTVCGSIIACFYDNGVPIDATPELFKKIADRY